MGKNSHTDLSIHPTFHNDIRGIITEAKSAAARSYKTVSKVNYASTWSQTKLSGKIK